MLAAVARAAIPPRPRPPGGLRRRPLQQQVVEVVAGVGWMGDPDPPPLGMEPTGGALRDLEADALAIMVGEEDDAGDLGRQDDLLQIAR